MSSHELASPIVLMAIFLVGTTIGFSVGRYRTHLFQNRGEAKVARALRGYTAPDYHLLNHVTLPWRDRSTQIDHILISRFGIFVIETKDYSGWIFGRAEDRDWTQVIYGNKFRFRNPLRQNEGHVRAVEALLDFLPANAIASAVVFTGEAKFKTKVPHGVFTVEELVAYVASQRTEVISTNRVQFCVGRLEMARLSISKETDVAHVQRLRRRFGITD